ncbi:hypothetical protein CVS40_5335 [Lucilia cuprina]|nr:hypothetical protein CVS40_5335 [Lucilia cuprina]
MKNRDEHRPHGKTDQNQMKDQMNNDHKATTDLILTKNQMNIISMVIIDPVLMEGSDEHRPQGDRPDSNERINEHRPHGDNKPGSSKDQMNIINKVTIDPAPNDESGEHSRSSTRQPQT